MSMDFFRYYQDLIVQKSFLLIFNPQFLLMSLFIQLFLKFISQIHPFYLLLLDYFY